MQRDSHLRRLMRQVMGGNVAVYREASRGNPMSPIIPRLIDRNGGPAPQGIFPRSIRLVQ